MKDFLLILYGWVTTILYIGLILWLASIPYLVGTGEGTESTKILFRILVYAGLFVLIYRSLIFTLKNTVDRLSKWKSKREKEEDQEFSLIVETLIVLLAGVSSFNIALLDEFLQIGVAGREASLVDILVSLMSIVTTSIVIYSYPVIGELEVYLHNRLKSKK